MIATPSPAAGRGAGLRRRPGVLLARVPQRTRRSASAGVAATSAASPPPTAGVLHEPRAVMGQVPGEVVRPCLGVFNPAVVVPAVAYGWTLVDAAKICAARTQGAVAQLRRLLGDSPEGLDRANELLARAVGPCGRGPPALQRSAQPVALGELLADAWRRSMCRGAAVHVAARTAGFDATEIGHHRAVRGCRCGPTSARGRGATPSSTRPRGASSPRPGRRRRLHRRRSCRPRSGRAGDRRLLPPDRRRPRRRPRRASSPSSAVGAPRSGTARATRHPAPTTWPARMP